VGYEHNLSLSKNTRCYRRGPPCSRGQPHPSGKVRLARGLNAPSAKTVSLEGTCTHVTRAPAPVYGHLML
jgi:hypothetical protein